MPTIGTNAVVGTVTGRPSPRTGLAVRGLLTGARLSAGDAGRHDENGAAGDADEA
jgi:hypothetical protein